MNSDDFMQAWLSYEGGLRGKALKYLSNRGDAEEAVQEIFLKTYPKRNTITDERHLLRHAHTALRNYSMDFQRKRRHELRYGHELRKEYKPEGDGISDIEQSVLVREVEEAFCALPAHCMETLQSAYRRQGTLAEEARATGIPVSTIRSREAKAIAEVQKELKIPNPRYSSLYRPKIPRPR